MIYRLVVYISILIGIYRPINRYDKRFGLCVISTEKTIRPIEMIKRFKLKMEYDM